MESSGLIVLLSLMSAVAGEGNINPHENFCKSIPDYGKLNYTKVDVTIYTHSMEKDCREEMITECMEVPDLTCSVSHLTLNRQILLISIAGGVVQNMSTQKGYVQSEGVKASDEDD